MSNRRFDRREFFGLSAGAAALTGATWRPGRALAHIAPQEPDLVVYNAKVYTIDPALARAEAFAVKAGRFVAVGSSDEMRSLVGPKTQTYDARQMTVVPGFIDAHNHAPGPIL